MHRTVVFFAIECIENLCWNFVARPGSARVLNFPHVSTTVFPASFPYCAELAMGKRKQRKLQSKLDKCWLCKYIKRDSSIDRLGPPGWRAHDSWGYWNMHEIDREGSGSGTISVVERKTFFRFRYGNDVYAHSILRIIFIFLFFTLKCILWAHSTEVCVCHTS